MELQKTVRNIFHQLKDSLERLDEDQYSFPCANLSGNTIGQHVRHIIEMFQCLEQGYQLGDIDYEARKRDLEIETNKSVAAELLNQILIDISKENRSLFLLTYYDESKGEPDKIVTNYYREIAYNLEHTIHHMALIRVGLREIGDFPVDESYGVASSTIKYRHQCAQ